MEYNRESMMANEPIGGLIWKLSLPAMVAMFVNGLYNVVDTIYIGHGVGSMGIAGLSVAFPIQMMIGGIGLMLGVGTASIISRSFGARDYEKAHRAFGNNLLGILIFGFLLVFFGSAFLRPILRLFGASEEIMPYAAEYMSVIFIGSPLTLFTMSMNNIIRSEGAARTAMGSMLVGAIANIILDPIFIFTLGLGIRGAAVATVLSRVFVIVWVTWFYRSGRSFISIRARHLAPRLGILKEIIIVGFPTFLQRVSSSFVYGWINQLLGAYGGNIAVAVFGINNRVIMYSAMPAMGIAQGMLPITGFNYGARKYGRALEAVKTSNFMALALCSAITTALLIFPGPTLKIFTSDRALLEAGIPAMRLMVAGTFSVGYNRVGGSFFQALGKALPAFLVNSARPILFFLPLLAIMPRLMGITGIWLSFSVADILSFILTVFLLLPATKDLRSLDLATEGAR